MVISNKMLNEHPSDKALVQPVYMTDGEFAIRTEPTNEDTGACFRAFIKQGLDDEYEVDFSVRTIADVLLYGKEITKEEYDEWAKPF